MNEGPALDAVIVADPSGRGHLLRLPAMAGEPSTAAGPVGSAAQLIARALDNAALLGNGPLQGAVVLDAGAWPLGISGLNALVEVLAGRQLLLGQLISSNPRTHVAAGALGLPCHWPPDAPELIAAAPINADQINADRTSADPVSAQPAAPGDLPGQGLLVHRGTLRSGDHLQANGTVLVLGDVNPGARISAGGHVLVWGRLRGSAHAGCQGDAEARIVALQLRPLQLRIADAVARGPEGTPPAGLAEEARIVDGVIQIDPAPPTWPLSG